MIRAHTLIGLTVMALVPVVAGAQTPAVGNPHGDMDLDCKLCHTEQNWDAVATMGDFDHASTGYPLEGMHEHVACRDCHREPVFAHIGIRCADCHMDSHKGRLGPACEECHTPTGWVDRTESQLQHDTTRLPLVGAHARVDCDACHQGAVTGEYVGTPFDCFACHRDSYEGAVDPDHLAAGFGTDCERCHGVFSSTWGSGDFLHAPNFPLTGAHVRIACTDCHVDGVFAGTPTDCFACHQTDYEQTVDPDHIAELFPTDCTVCHTTTAWTPADFDHNVTAFPLTGAHRGEDCASCHSAGYVGTPTDCYACHQSNYEQTNDPDHLATGFSTDCAFCHNTTDWVPADWDHEEIFPIESGAHEGMDCAECHVVPTDYKAFECILCHEHNQSDTDNDHDEINEPEPYVYASPNCYSCHPRGRS